MRSLRIALALCTALAFAAPSCGQDVSWFVHPTPVTAGVPFQVIGAGIWPDTCIPIVVSVGVDSGTVRIDTQPETDLCFDQPQQFVTPASVRPLLEGSYTVEIWFTDVFFGGEPELLTALTVDVEPAVTTIDLGEGDRFQVQVEWATTQGTSGPGVPTLSSEDSALFWFFDPQNWEMMVKVLDGCTVNGHHWVFLAASTNVEYTLRIVDSQGGAAWTYTNPQGRLSPAVADTGAFDCAP